MAEIWPDEGLDLLLDIFPRGNATQTSSFLCLFTAFSASTVGTAGQNADAYTEPSGGSYARQTIVSASWGAIGAGSGSPAGRKSTASQITFPTATAAWGTINGFWLANQLSASGDKAWFAANFDDTTAVTINTNDIIKVTPTIEYDN